MVNVSVIMPVYNGAMYLRQAVDSILTQSYRDFEFIVVDDCSTDDTPVILSRYAQQDRRVQIARNERNMGVADSLNLGLALAKGDYVARQDADDISLPERLAAQVAFLNANSEVGLLGTQGDFIDSTGAPVVGKSWRFALDDKSLQKQILNFCPFFHGSVMMRRQHLEKAGQYEPDQVPAEDYDLWLRMAEVTQLANLESVLYLYRLHQGSIGYNARQQQVVRVAQVLERAIRRRFGEQLTELQWEPAARSYLQASLYNWAMFNFDVARQALEHAALVPTNVLTSDQYLEQAMTQIAQNMVVEERANFYESVLFDLMCNAPIKPTVRIRLASRLHLHEVIMGADAKDWRRVYRHLWWAFRYDPKLLLNRGLLSLSLKAMHWRFTAKQAAVCS